MLGIFTMNYSFFLEKLCFIHIDFMPQFHVFNSLIITIIM